MNIWVHLILTLVILYNLIAYTVCGWIIFFFKREDVQKAREDVGIAISVLFWILSPVMMLDVLYQLMTKGSAL